MGSGSRWLSVCRANRDATRSLPRAPAECPCRGGRLVDPVAAPGTGNSHIDLFCYLIPGQALVAKLQDLLRGSRMSEGTAPTHGDAGTTKVMAHCRRRDA
jgi:hypothetical protein